ncbi:Phage repressor protein C [Fructobacillus cardui]|uniref:Contains Cro/C1-type HTH and peptisase s24 domains n=2 Tax=Fructobacillus cardui TaxID=2893170 RepID=A0ABN9YWH9_9LACO|nr:Phage repressor protein C [Fructobacillus cardui]
MNREIYLKELIETKYGSVRRFAETISVPYTTIRSILERGVLNAKMDNIIHICKGLGITPEQLYDFNSSIITNINKAVIQLNDERKNNVYHYANDQLEEQNKVVQMPTTNTVEVYGAVSAGTGEYMVDNQPEEVDYSGTVPEHDFAVTVNGDSMTPLFDDKQIIFVKKAHEARSGQIVIADYDGQAYVKKFVHDNNGCRLVSLNKKYHDLPINEEHEMSLFGIVVL